MLMNCSAHGILPSRVAAIDARRGQLAPLNVAEDVSEPIPTEVVTRTWNSSLNAKFDKKCRINTVTPMTPSERACAASHIILWKLIYEIFTLRNCAPNTDELNSYLNQSTITGDVTRKSASITSSNIDTRKRLFRPLPNSRVYNAIPNIWPSSPRPEYQIHLSSELEQQAQVQDLCDLLSLRHQSCLDHFGKFFLILEDDAVIDPHPKIKGKYANPHIKKLIKKNFLQRVKEIEDKIPSDFDICYLGYSGKTFKRSVKKILVRPQYVWQLHAYLLSPKGAAKLLSKLPVSAPVDNFIATLIYERQLEVTLWNYKR